jgi:hypothetical protein
VGSNDPWSHGVVQNRAQDGRRVRMLTVIVGNARECLVLPMASWRRSDDLPAVLADLFAPSGPPERIGSADGDGERDPS